MKRKKQDDQNTQPAKVPRTNSDGSSGEEDSTERAAREAKAALSSEEIIDDLDPSDLEHSSDDQGEGLLLPVLGTQAFQIEKCLVCLTPGPYNVVDKEIRCKFESCPINNRACIFYSFIYLSLESFIHLTKLIV